MVSAVSFASLLGKVDLFELIMGMFGAVCFELSGAAIIVLNKFGLEFNWPN